MSKRPNRRTPPNAAERRPRPLRRRRYTKSRRVSKPPNAVRDRSDAAIIPNRDAFLKPPNSRRDYFFQNAFSPTCFPQPVFPNAFSPSRPASTRSPSLPQPLFSPFPPNRQIPLIFRAVPISPNTPSFRPRFPREREKISPLAKNFLKKTPRQSKNVKMVFTQTGKIVKIRPTMKRVAPRSVAFANFASLFCRRFADVSPSTFVKIGATRVS